MNPYLEHLAQRVADAPDFLAFALAEYARSEQLDEGGLAGRLGCPLEILIHLRLCRMPRAEVPMFRQDVDRIAQRFSADADALAEIVRRGQSLRQLQVADATVDRGQGFLMAARDDERRPEPPEGAQS